MGLTENDVYRMGDAAKQQIVDKLSKPNKCRNTPVNVRMPDGSVRKFDSRIEADRYGQLRILQRAGQIHDLRLQVKYELIPDQVTEAGKKERGCDYIADFVYRRGDKLVVEDVKGYRGGAVYSLFKVKRKLMLQRYGITVHEWPEKETKCSK